MRKTPCGVAASREEGTRAARKHATLPLLVLQPQLTREDGGNPAIRC
jgi:hypothetical protein